MSDEHRVTLNLTVAKAFPTVDEEVPKPITKGIGGIKGRRRVYEAPKPHHYFHIEYKLLPDDIEPVKTDIVTYGVAAKIYMDNESKVLKTWREGNKTWVTWTHSHRLTITKDLLLKLYNHSLEIKIWDTKEKVSPKARFDRPKAFRLSAIEEGDESCVRSLVMKQTNSFHSLQPKESVTETPPGVAETNGAESHHSKSPSKDAEQKSESKHLDPSRATTGLSSFPSTSMPETPTTPGQQSLVRVQVRIDENHTPQFGRIAQLAGVTPPAPDTPRDPESSSRMSKTKADESRLTPKRWKSKTGAPVKEQANKQKKLTHGKHPTKRDIAAAAAAHVRVHGTATLSIKLSQLFSGIKTTTTRLQKPSGYIQDLLLSVNLDKPLLSETQRKDLNPMVVQVNSASSMPNTPLSYRQLKDKCKPVYLEYQFYDQTKHISSGREHGREIFWSDLNVVLLGNINKDLLAEYLQGPPLQIEVHDRERKMKNQKMKPSIFGENPEDEMINNVALVAGRRTTHNPFQGREKTWDPYGIAKFDLSGLLLGQTLLELRSPIHCCPIPDTNLGHEDPDGPIVGRPGNVDGPQSKPMPTANYLEAGSELKIKVTLAYPLNAKGERDDISATEKPGVHTECPFGRLVYTFKYSNTKFLGQIQNEITAINAEALELDSLPQHVIQAALSTYKLSKDQRKSTNLDIITGFQVLDGEFHVFVLEGIANEGIKRLWHGLPRPLEPDPEVFNVLYNSEMTFSSRLYASLDVDLCRVRLHEPLQSIAKNPLLYVRDLVPKPCFEAVTKLDKILRVTKLREATQSDLFPSAEMVISMSREFGVPLTAEDFGELEEVESTRQRQAVIELGASKPRRPWTPLESHNTSYEKKLKERMNTVEKNFVQENIKITKTMEKERPRTIAVDRSELFMEVAHNYSIQSLNTTEQAKEKLRQMLAKEKDNCYTYCPRYNSAIVLPVEPDAVKKRERLNSVQKWRTPQGFIFPGKKTSIESNFHHKKPDSARLDELNKPWKENVLHSNTLKPTVDREIFPWPFRDKDFDINLSRPRPTYLDLQTVKSIHPAGDIKELEIRQSQEADAKKWQEKLVVDNPIFRTHRCLTETELKARGRNASNQPAKLVGLLKDPPKKLALQKPGSVHEIPSLGVVSDPSTDTVARNSGKLQPRDSSDILKSTKGFNPGPFENEGWLLEKNKIPIIDSQHKKYEALRGQDFWLFHKEKDPVYQRRIEPLKTEEKDNHLFAVADPCS